MHLVVSGEGKTDIGIGSYVDDTFIPAPMYYIIDKIIEKKLLYSIYDLTPEQITFIPKPELMKVCKSIKFLTGKKREQETGFFYKNAIGLSRITKKICEIKDDDDVVAILFRDSDGTRATPSNLHDKKIKAIEDAFETEKINGVSMVPNPKSESWLICSLQKTPYQNCEKLEQRSGNDDSPNSLKKELDEILEAKNIKYDDINEMIKNSDIDIDKIDMKSYVYFRNKLEELL